MSSLVFTAGLDGMARGTIDFAADSFYAMLVTFDYIPDKDAHVSRADVTDEVASGGGYVTGGFETTVSVTKNPGNVEVSLGALLIPGATVTARGAVYYKRRGGPSSADELVAYIDFNSDIVSTAGNWSLTASKLRLQN